MSKSDAPFPAESFHRWRSPVRGTRNPEVMSNPVWQWLVQTRLSAYAATDMFGGGHSSDGPGWCFNRFGQSRTVLADGRAIHIAGEHEDHYDPDFYIYNDVVIESPDGAIEILGYPVDVFPPTDFHSATLIGDRIIVVGSLGYPNDRRAGYTQVLALDVTSFQIARIEPQGAGPGWLHEHRAEISEDGSGLLIAGGLIDRGEGRTLVENIDDWHLAFDGWRWQRLTSRQWTRFEVQRVDGHMLHLWFMRNALTSQQFGWDDFDSQVTKLTNDLGGPPRLDLVSELYRPGIAHDALIDGAYNVVRIRIGGTVVRYLEEAFYIRVTIEGELAVTDVERLRADLIAKLHEIERAEIVSREIL